LAYSRRVPTAPSSTDALNRLLGRGVHEVWRDEDVWVLDKPAGVLSHPNPPAKRAGQRIGSTPSTTTSASCTGPASPGKKASAASGSSTAWTGETSGLILCALTEDAAARIKEALERRR